MEAMNFTQHQAFMKHTLCTKSRLYSHTLLFHKEPKRLSYKSYHEAQPRGGHLGIFWVGMCRPGLQIGTPF